MEPGNDPKTYAIIGAAMEVHRHLGCGFLEGVYQDALAIEFALREIPFEREPELAVFYRQKRLSHTYRPDFICHDDIIVELKAITKIGTSEEAQLINYLKASSFPRGLLLNFGAVSLEYKRLVFTQSVKSA